MLPLISPCWEITAGAWRLQKVRRFDVHSSRVHPVDTAELEVVRRGFPVEAIHPGDPLEIWQGYRGIGVWLIFRGTITQVQPGESVVIRASCQAERLRRVRVAQAFDRATPQDVVRFCLQRAGVQRVEVSSTSLPPKVAFNASGTVLAVLQQVRQSWKLDDWAFYFEPEGTFWWGPWQESRRYREQAEIVTLAYGRDLMRHEVQDGGRQGLIETIALPFLRHSHRLNVADHRFWGGTRTVRIERVRYHADESKSRTWIEWSLPERS